jgi:16S rRNA A1518/A1519 N6-dimethyltransferase RsmA/KsgA/DIM1 with predicted DNA glycosylase/AP lyase activity
MKFRIAEELTDDVEDNEDVEAMNKTSRPDDYTSVTTKFIMGNFSPDQNLTFLDYGAGKKAIQTKKLIEAGYNVTAYEIGKNVTELHDANALSKKYDVVFASNVLNVQRRMKRIEKMLSEMDACSKKYIIMNYPSSPRKFIDHYINNKEMKETIEQILGKEFQVYPNTIFVHQK